VATWDEVQAFCRASYRVERDEPAAIALTWEMTAGDQQLVQGVGLAPMAVHGRPWLTMVADLFAESVLPLRIAVLYQDRLPFGALVLRDGAFLIRHGMPLAELTLAELDWTIRTLAHEAGTLRVNARQFATTGSPFGNYAE
jgi:hypothetical protein